jgi:hypothetical protein
VKDVGLFPTAYAQSDVQQVQICGYRSRYSDPSSLSCASVWNDKVDIRNDR